MGRCCTEAYSERSRTGKSEILSKIINGWKLASILAKTSILDGRQGSAVDFKLCVGLILWKFLLMKDFKKGWDKFKIIIAALETPPPPAPPPFFERTSCPKGQGFATHLERSFQEIGYFSRHIILFSIYIFTFTFSCFIFFYSLWFAFHCLFVFFSTTRVNNGTDNFTVNPRDKDS